MTFDEWWESTIFSASQMGKAQARAAWEAATLAERKRIAEIFDKEAAIQEKVWDKFLAEKNNKSATSFHTVFRDMADKIRSGKQ